MRKLLTACLLVFTTIVVSSCAGTQNSIVGTWTGKVNDQPAVELTVRGDSGPLEGTIVLYRPERGSEEPLVDPRFDGRILSFRVAPADAHAVNPDAEPIVFRFTMAGPQEGELVRSYQDEETHFHLLKTK